METIFTIQIINHGSKGTVGESAKTDGQSSH